MHVKEIYVRERAYIDRGINEMGWLKNLTLFTAGASYIASLYGADILVILPFIALMLLIFSRFIGKILLEKIRIVEAEIKFQNSLHSGYRIEKKKKGKA